MSVAGHQVFPVLVLWLLVQLTHSGANAMGYSLLRCGRYVLRQPYTVAAQNSVTVPWCLDLCARNNPPYEYGALRRFGNTHGNAACYCVTAAVPTWGNSFCTRHCGSGGTLQCGGRRNGYDYVSVYRDVNECADHNGGCNQTCVNSAGSFSCQCRDGYEKTGNLCIDIDECTTDNGGCDHTCTNTQGGYSCSCREGYISDNTTCTDIDECADPRLHSCPPTDKCRNTNGSFECLHPAATTTLASVVTDIDECHDSPCDQFCHYVNGGFRCYCKPGWAIMEDNVTCTAIEGFNSRSSTTPPVWMYAVLGFLVAVVLAMTVVIVLGWRCLVNRNNMANRPTAFLPVDPHPGYEGPASTSPAAVSREERPTDPEASAAPTDSQYEHIKIYTNSEAGQGVYEKVQ